MLRAVALIFTLLYLCCVCCVFRDQLALQRQQSALMQIFSGAAQH